MGRTVYAQRDGPVFQSLRRKSIRSRIADWRESTDVFSRLVAGLNERFAGQPETHLDIGTIDELITIGLAMEMAVRLEELVADGHAEALVVMCFLATLTRNAPGKGLYRHVIRLVRRANKQHPVPRILADAISELMRDVDRVNVDA